MSSQDLIKFYTDLFEENYFSCVVDTEADTNGAIEYFHGNSVVNCTLMGPFHKQRNSDNIKLNIEVSVRGDPSLKEGDNKSLEEKLKLALIEIIKIEDYPHLTLRVLITIKERSSNLYPCIFNSAMLCLFQNGVNLKGTCFAIDFSFDDDEISFFNKEIETDEDSASFVVINLINNQILQLETVDSVSIEKLGKLKERVNLNLKVLKVLVKQYLFNSMIK